MAGTSPTRDLRQPTTARSDEAARGGPGCPTRVSDGAVRVGWLLLLTISGLSVGGRLQQVTAAAPAAIDFNRDIRPILSNSCFQCHGPDENTRKAGLRLDRPEGLFGQGESGATSVVPGHSETSEVLRRVLSKDPAERMPPEGSGKTLSGAEVDRLRAWIDEGATFTQHWSYITPQRPRLPEIRNHEWPRQPLDTFVLSRLERESLTPAPAADRFALIRRLSLDLTGLPPTFDGAREFANDEGHDALDRVVDRLLAQPTFGEHWGRRWLDLARYADSAGYADDPLRTIWKYRDWVIRATNSNMPFDQFTLEQLAGDLFPAPTQDQLIATAFHRNTMTNSEGGTDDEEFRSLAVVDRVNTTMAVWMGTTMACAQCHSHKYDPISQLDYFRLFAILNNTEDSDKKDERPLLEIAQDATTVPILRELAGDQRRTTRLQRRGNFMDLGEVVAEGLPETLHAAVPAGPVSRRALAEWLIDPRNPLTSRVVANRYWEALFGVGLVRTSEEFGSQGDAPSHPELLDWLARELVRLRWDTKAFIKLIVTSATYGQSSRVTAADYERDPDNRNLARGPRFRMSAEVIRDQALWSAGLLSHKMYGESVYPPQPQLGLNAAFGGAIDWKASQGEDRYRRGIYTSWRRSNPYPSMATFDAPNSEVCTVRRVRTNTPLQSLVTLNDPAFVEAAQALARQWAADGGSDIDKIRRGFQRCLVRDPSDREVETLLNLYHQASQALEPTHQSTGESAPDPALALATVPIGPIPESWSVSARELAAWTVVANVLLNVDELFLKR